MLKNIRDKLTLLPTSPGCYLMKDKTGTIIYVGKAKNLKRRVSSYFNRTHTGKTARLVKDIVDFEYIVVGSNTESLVLEINLIKKYDPKYNILLRDDKSYPYIELTNEKYPRLLVVRNINLKKNNRNRMYGPYPNVGAARETVNLLNRLYPLRKCNTMPKRPCLYYHIGECLGYCFKDIDNSTIKQMEDEIIKFLKGDASIVIKKLEDEMEKESSLMHYEKAKELKELLDYVNITLVKQKVEINDTKDIDVFGYYIDKGYLSVQVFFIRGSKLVERHSKIWPIIDEVDEELTKYISYFYNKDVLLPKEILVPNIVDMELIKEYLNVNISSPSRGVKKNIIDMACDNAKISLEEKFDLIKKDEARTYEANEELKNILGLEKLDRIELFDNSHLFGSFNVSGMVVFIEGLPAKNEYRKFKITNDKNDDYGTMREAMYRRYFRVLKDNLTRPDLIIVDGGKGQMTVAHEVIDGLHMNIPIVGLKKDDKHSTNALIYDKEIEIDKSSNLFHYLERMQDEVHNFTINYHRKLRSKGAITSILDNIEGIGPNRRNELLKKFRSIKKMSEASIEELDEILPHKVSVNLKEFLESYRGV
ncbi:MAG: excinuclease ABC subunit UvrC [Bacilli bacterium]|nr:excinuclease ABC subunit UvrC [Bacilli bacterium]